MQKFKIALCFMISIISLYITSYFGSIVSHAYTSYFVECPFWVAPTMFIFLIITILSVIGGCILLSQQYENG